MRFLGANALPILAALEAGRRFHRQAGGWAAGGLNAPDSLVAELERRGMIRLEGERLLLAAEGRTWCDRRRERVGPGPRLLVEKTLPEPEEAPKAGRRRSPRAARSVTINLAESPLGWLKARGLVDARQYEAGERLRSDWMMAGMGPRVTMRWDASGRSGAGGGPGGPDALDPTLAQIAAKRRMEAAMEAVGSGLKDVLWRIVCAGEGMETAERALGWPARAGRVVLTLALDRLADFYGLP